MRTQSLLDRGFALVGEWRSEMGKVHRVDWIRHKPGVYAFVVDDVICYVGKADCLHRRLRNYSRRVFGKRQQRDLRACHEGIAVSVTAGRPVSVYALVIEPESPLSNLQMETLLRNEFHPPWDRASLQMVTELPLGRRR